MAHHAEEFLVDSEAKAFDKDHRRIINFNIGRYDAAVERGLSRLINLDNAKKKGHVIKWRVMENLDKFLPEFEANFQKRGGKVIWANDAEEANRAGQWQAGDGETTASVGIEGLAHLRSHEGRR